MAEDNKGHKRVEIGFAGGQAISVQIAERDYDKLRKEVRGGDGWYELDTADGPVSLDLRKIVFVKSDTPDHRIGFSGL
ncbi:MAG: hypothetical protein WDZ37_07570 [Solirubrobacterales bacterium]